MRRLLKNFLKWVMAADRQDMRPDAPISIAESTSSVEARFRLGIIKAMNGMAIEISSYKPNPHGPDWKHELYLIRDGENVSDAIKVILATKAIEQ